MKVLLHNPITHLFLRSIGEWTIDQEEAVHFPDVTAAERYCQQHHLYGTQMFLKFNPPDYTANAEREGHGMVYTA